jgi:hypothetical protein
MHGAKSCIGSILLAQSSSKFFGATSRIVPQAVFPLYAASPQDIHPTHQFISRAFRCNRGWFSIALLSLIGINWFSEKIPNRSLQETPFFFVK